MKKLMGIVICLGIVLLIPALSHAFSVTLAWDASPSQDVNEYVMHYDSHSGTPKANSESAGMELQITITGLTDGVMTYFHVTAKDWEGRESGPSNEVATDGIVTPDTGQNPTAPGGCYIVAVEPD